MLILAFLLNRKDDDYITHLAFNAPVTSRAFKRSGELAGYVLNAFIPMIL